MFCETSPAHSANEGCLIARSGHQASSRDRHGGDEIDKRLHKPGDSENSNEARDLK
jgi:hypothetical protein